MSPYTRHQLVLLLALIGAAGAGLGIDHWRRAHPDVAEGLELLDRAPLSPVPAAAHHRAPAPRPTTAASRAHPAALIDLNRAPADELERLPGVGRAIATRIVHARPFASVDDLARVRGLRGARLARLRTLVTVAR
ncbi:MAG TPA: helix-hairpin-helix domain-containing protein [Candidatus Limnocylindria bacterium]|nr:helix-hairpin-helix domain-containing protein [Candidatus Limnocylindria bacterium]